MACKKALSLFPVLALGLLALFMLVPVSGNTSAAPLGCSIQNASVQIERGAITVSSDHMACGGSVSLMFNTLPAPTSVQLCYRDGACTRWQTATTEQQTLTLANNANFGQLFYLRYRAAGAGTPYEVSSTLIY